MRTRAADRCLAVMVQAALCGMLTLAPAVAETLSLRLAYADVPGTALILEGRLDDAIELLEERTRADPRNARRDERATLCGAYVASGRLSEARAACNDAVLRDAGHVAYNNRGVLRARLGDIAGAIEDFDRVQVAPQNMEAYLATLAERNVRLMATANLERLRQLEARRAERHDRDLPGQALRGVVIEDPTVSDNRR